MFEVKTIQGEIFTDHRGQISSLNDFVFEEVERFYFIHHPDKNVVRGWHGHQHEKKWFYCVKGSFTIALVQPDDWNNPSTNLPADIIQLSEKDSKILCVPEGYANCIKAGEDNSILLVFSGKRNPEAYEDSWRYDSHLWVDWQKY
ncbi:WxcM domain protein [Capnocytophaga ochracea DSM 7271]|uniref:WxcM domain protein n=1 Tax=Capnocytophaga ochracea (strain ATCC 27872 / DSM 7271 / CCUG 9716 / JCM 12966 / NCTC 12371 / SS31 / VPI 2845) TaxID=521097 RepID=C7M4B0_CAPOD|nr:WxcM-like domain-containing protein [Capnocytophaga ochracea]ACU92665.1 WxcM domain protein [Capnocytophaga ochracea DSM 7271]UAK51388.1 WxcM-like domain-containing protein [Capnocytophaga ochracea]